MGNKKYKSEEKYTWEKIGERIKFEREQNGLTQKELMLKIGRSEESYRILGRWEKGITRPQFSDIIELCKVFDCELGYLLCEYDCKTREATDIQQATGLCQQAINRLTKLKSLRPELDSTSRLLPMQKVFNDIELVNLILSRSDSVNKMCEYIVLTDHDDSEIHLGLTDKLTFDDLLNFKLEGIKNAFREYRIEYLKQNEEIY